MNCDFDRMEQILNNAKEIKVDFKLIEREIKYKILVNKFSPAYASGSLWYIGRSIKEYIDKKDIRLFAEEDVKLKFLYQLLDNMVM